MNKKVMCLLSIVEENHGKKLIKELSNLQIKINFQISGYGTAPTEMLDIFGVGSKGKDIILSLGSEQNIRNLVKNFGQKIQNSTKYSGLMMIFNTSATSRILCEILNYHNIILEKDDANMKNEYDNNLIAISVNEGFSEDVMNVARKNGATGGTVIKGHLANTEQFAEYIDTKVDGEREILLILAPSKTSKDIMIKVNEEFGIKSAANGIIFALPIEKAFKI